MNLLLIEPEEIEQEIDVLLYRLPRKHFSWRPILFKRMGSTFTYNLSTHRHKCVRIETTWLSTQ